MYSSMASSGLARSLNPIQRVDLHNAAWRMTTASAMSKTIRPPAADVATISADVRGVRPMADKVLAERESVNPH
jgi:hypothetical protein